MKPALIKKILALTFLVLLFGSIITPFAFAKTLTDSTYTYFGIEDDNGEDETGNGGDDDWFYEEDKDKEKPKPEKTKYSEWTCINHQFQRTATLYGLSTIEYGGVCNLTIDKTAKDTKDSNNHLIILNFALLGFISLILIIIFLLKK